MQYATFVLDSDVQNINDVESCLKHTKTVFGRNAYCVHIKFCQNVVFCN